MMHCAAMNNHTDVVEYIVNDLQMGELDKEDIVRKCIILTLYNHWNPNISEGQRMLKKVQEFNIVTFIIITLFVFLSVW